MSEKWDVLGHELVPDHKVLSKEETEELLKRFKIEAFQMPRIKSTDPAAMACGAKPGEIVKITRKSPTAGKVLAYRYVIEG